VVDVSGAFPACQSPTPQNLTIVPATLITLPIIQVLCFGSVRVTVLDDQQDPLGGATVTISSGGLPLISSTTASTGIVTINGLAPGNVTVAAARPSGVPICAQASSPAQVQIGTTVALQFELLCHTSIQGFVRDANTGSPVDGIVSLGGVSKTFHSGQFDLSGLPNTSSTRPMTITGAGCTSTQVAVTLAPGTVNVGTISLACFGNLIGRVDSPLGGPLGGVTVSAGGKIATTAADGSYQIHDLATGGVSVVLSNLPTSCSTPASVQTAVVRAVSRQVNFAPICPGFTFNGIVQTSLGGLVAPAPNMHVTLVSSSGTVFTTTTIANGSYSMANLRPGPYTLVLSQPPLPSCVLPPPLTVTVSGTSVLHLSILPC
jgi:hypothetical protein